MSKEQEFRKQTEEAKFEAFSLMCKKVEELEQQIEKMKKYGKLLLDICEVMGNDPYVIWAGLQNRVKTLWDTDEEERGYKMTEDILDRMLKITAVDWAEIDKWEIKENV